MPTECQRLDDFHAIRRYVNQILCEKDQLEADLFPLYQRVLMRGGAPCGVYFYLYGPRSLCLTAIWETDGNTILFYGSRGERFRRTQLIAPPCIDDAVGSSNYSSPGDGMTAANGCEPNAVLSTATGQA